MTVESLSTDRPKTGQRAARALGVALALSALAMPMVTATPAGATTVTQYVSDNCATAGSWDCYNGINVLNVQYSPTNSDGSGGGAWAKFLGNVSDYNGAYGAGDGMVTYYAYRFGNYGSGVGQPVRNNAASAMGCGSRANYRIYYSPGYQGSSQYIEGSYGCEHGVNLASWLRNDNASQHWA
ncbi:hypothetical protein ACIRBX_01825 [Kitasatospora sp. NPDC096147]|uniref:hypothetical protein n=1 Tax=Kitasatospora sp. NPDC096147 TaxID=3364093 RepID=UPI003826A686